MLWQPELIKTSPHQRHWLFLKSSSRPLVMSSNLSRNALPPSTLWTFVNSVLPSMHTRHPCSRPQFCQRHHYSPRYLSLNIWSCLPHLSEAPTTNFLLQTFCILSLFTDRHRDARYIIVFHKF